MGRLCTVAVAGLVALSAPAVARASALPAGNASDGRIYYSVGAVLPDPDAEAGSQIYSIKRDGTGIRQLTHVAAPGQAGDPDVSPDGTRVLYVSNALNGTYQVWTMRTDGTGQRLVVADPGHDAFVPRWSPNGRRLLFTRCSFPFGFLECTTAVANRNGSGLHDITSGNWQDFSAAWSPDGSTIAVASDRGGYFSAISLVPAGGGRPHRITPPDTEAFWADYSPDGQRILFGNNFDRPTTDHFTMTPSGGNVTQLTHFAEGTTGGFARYSPSGSSIVFDYYDGVTDRLAVSDADGGNTRFLTETGNLTLADWGAVVMKRLVLVLAAGALTALSSVPSQAAAPPRPTLAIGDVVSGQLYTLAASGAGLTQLTHVTKRQLALDPSWSPDGSRIAYTMVFRDGRERTFSIAADGTDARQIGDDTAEFHDDVPDWFPDGGHIAFARCLAADPGFCGIARIATDGTGLTMLTSPPLDVFDFNPDVSPDGTHIAFTRFGAGGVRSQVWIMNADGSDAHPVTRAVLEANVANWSSDGQSLTVSSHCCRLGGDIYRLPAQGGATTRLTHTSYPNYSGGSAASPDDRRLAFVSDRDHPDKCCIDLFTMNADGSDQVKIETGLVAVATVSWRPSG